MTVSGKIFKDAILSGANNILNQRNAIDELNVFPVPDGDTGTNMSMTIKSTITELKLLPDDCTVSQASDVTASAMLRGARGNSGVILSLLFRGLSRGLQGKGAATASDFAKSLTLGVEAAYKSVMKPTEGTMLTVAREAAEAAVKFSSDNTDIKSLFELLVKEAKSSLDKTPELLPVLKKAGVVDAGGMGYLVILEGMKQVIDGNGIVSAGEKTEKKQKVITNAAGTFETDILFTYCTEFIVQKSPNSKNHSALRAYLETIGDSVVVVDDDDIIKVHIHTDHPGKALEEGILFGSLTNLKIENMREQHKGQAVKAELQKKTSFTPVPPENKYGFVSVANGSGIEALFSDLGVDCIVKGGQTSNPSTEDILEAILATPAHNVFVLPNNKNIIMAAEQAAKLSDRNVTVLQSRTVPQGISAMLSFDPDRDLNANAVAMTKALDKVGTGSVTFAARDSEFEGRKIKKGDIMALENGRLSFIDKDVTKALIKVTKKLIKSDTSYITVLYGSDVSDEAAEDAFKHLKDKISDDIEVVLVNGGQPIYYYIVSVE